MHADLPPDNSETSAAALRAAYGPGDSTEFYDPAFPPPVPPPDISGWPAQADRFELQEVLAHGGFGTVQRARDKKLGREVALKTLRDDLPSEPVLLRRLIEEAQISSQLQHPGVVPVYDYGLLGEGRPYIAMKLVRGRTLREILDDTEGDDAREALLPVLERICEAMAYAHSRGVVHRDLKPANIMVGRFGEVQVMDWGLAKVMGSTMAAESDSLPITTLRDQDDAVVSRAGDVFGTPAYMAPEQARGETHQVGLQSDVFSLGALLYESLTGRRIFDGDLRTEREGDVEGTVPDNGPWREVLVDASVEGDLCHLVMSCLHARPQDRPADAGFIAREISAYRASVAARAQKALLEAAEARSRAAAERRSRRLTVALAAVVVLFVIVGGCAWVWSEEQRLRRERDTATSLAGPMSRARAVMEAALASGTIDEGTWGQAISAVREVESAAAAGSVDELTKHKVVDLVRDVESEAEVAARSRSLRDRLDDISTWMAEDARRDKAYGAVFAEFGFDFHTLSEVDLARGLSVLRIPDSIAFALDDWGGLRRAAGDPHWRVLDRLRDASDPDHLRRDLRQRSVLKNPEEVQRAIAEIDVASVPPSTLRVVSQVYRSMEWHKERQTFLAVAAHHHPGDFWLRFLLGHAAMGAEDWASAVAECRAAVALRPECYSAWVNLAIALIEIDDHLAAVQALERALEIRDDVAIVWNNYGAALLQARRVDDAEAAYERATVLDPKLPEPWVTLAAMARARKDFKAAEQSYRRALAAGARCESQFATMLSKIGRQSDAIAVWRQGLKRDPDNPILLTNVGLAEYLEGNATEAESMLQLAWDLGPERPVPGIQLASLFRRTGRVHLSLPLLREVSSRFPADPQVAVKLGWLYAGLGRWVDAEREARRALGRTPTSELRGLLAHVLIGRGRYADALAVLDQVAAASGDADGVLPVDAPRRLCERLGGIDRDLPNLIKRPPTKARDLLDFARVLSARGWLPAAAETWPGAIAAKASLTQMDMESAISAILATADPDNRDSADTFALSYLRSYIRRMEGRISGSMPTALVAREELSIALERWLRGTGLASVRGKALEKLPENARDQWADFWTDVDDLLEHLRTQPARR